VRLLERFGFVEVAARDGLRAFEREDIVPEA